MSAVGELVSVNVGTPRFVSYRGKQVPTSIYKEPVPGRVAVRGVNLAGDVQADLRVHGGRDKAVYALLARGLRVVGVRTRTVALTAERSART